MQTWTSAKCAVKFIELNKNNKWLRLKCHDIKFIQQINFAKNVIAALLTWTKLTCLHRKAELLEATKQTT